MIAMNKTICIYTELYFKSVHVKKVIWTGIQECAGSGVREMNNIIWTDVKMFQEIN